MIKYLKKIQFSSVRVWADNYITNEELLVLYYGKCYM